MTWVMEPCEWALIYNVQPHDPIGFIQRAEDCFHARLEHEDLGLFSSGDEAAEAIWRRYVQKSYVQHEMASRTHGSDERH